MELLNTQEAIEFLGVSEATFWRKIKKYAPKKYRKQRDRNVYYDKADLEKIKAESPYEIVQEPSDAAA